MINLLRPTIYSIVFIRAKRFSNCQKNSQNYWRLSLIMFELLSSGEKLCSILILSKNYWKLFHYKMYLIIFCFKVPLISSICGVCFTLKTKSATIASNRYWSQLNFILFLGWESGKIYGKNSPQISPQPPAMFIGHRGVIW